MWKGANALLLSGDGFAHRERVQAEDEEAVLWHFWPGQQSNLSCLSSSPITNLDDEMEDIVNAVPSCACAACARKSGKTELE